MIKYLKRKAVSIQLWDRELDCVKEVGGGVEHGSPYNIAVLLHVDSDWVAYTWRHTGQIVYVPACDTLCIAADLPK